MQLRDEELSMGDIKSNLALERLVFDKIEFTRKGFKNDNEFKCSLQVKVGEGREHLYRVNLILSGEKENEYIVKISLSGYFRLTDEDDLDDGLAKTLISKNSVAIMMPYIRSQLTLLTAQPETESVVLPPFNINKIFEEE